MFHARVPLMRLPPADAAVPAFVCAQKLWKHIKDNYKEDE